MISGVIPAVIAQRMSSTGSPQLFDTRKSMRARKAFVYAGASFEIGDAFPTSDLDALEIALVWNADLVEFIPTPNVKEP